MAVTLKMIAERAKVSQMTVSRILNGKAEGQVSPEMVTRVRGIINELKYEINNTGKKAARFLTDSPAENTGVPIVTLLVPFQEYLDVSRPEIFQEESVMNGALKAALKIGVRIETLPISETISGVVPDWKRFAHIDERSRVLAFTTWYLPILTEFTRRGARIALISSEIFWRHAYERYTRDWALFTVKNVDGAIQLTDYLLSRGHSQIVLGTPFEGEPEEPISAGYSQALAAHGLSPHPVLKLARRDWNVSKKIILDAYRREEFDSIILALNPFDVDLDCRISIQKNLGLPEKVFVSFTSVIPGTSHFIPRPPGVSFPLEQMAFDAVSALLDEKFLPGELFYKGTLVTPESEDISLKRQ